MIDSFIVPINNDGFSILTNRKIYFYQRRKKERRDVKYIFFYRTAPIKAITHYGSVIKYIKDADNLINNSEKFKLFKDSNKESSAYKFEKIIKIKEPIRHTKNAPIIQKKIYIDSEILFGAKTTLFLLDNKEADDK